ncbi:hypothetical protein GGR55DRAFT_632515 [Xylaria sp. FL0064]|nr:hypothetical protein GGR55DRAFT_632515 [Xylaria sp. FL0064]
MNPKLYILAGLAGAATAAGFALNIPVPGPAAAAIFHPHHRRQENEDAMDLYLCSNPDFNHDCAGCACERLANLTTVGGYGGPPCYPLPYDLRVGNPQGVSSARSYSKWNCTLFDNMDCNGTLPGSSLNIPPGPPGMASLGPFDDRAVSYQCYALP